MEIFLQSSSTSLLLTCPFLLKPGKVTKRDPPLPRLYTPQSALRGISDGEQVVYCHSPGCTLPVRLVDPRAMVLAQRSESNSLLPDVHRSECLINLDSGLKNRCVRVDQQCEFLINNLFVIFCAGFSSFFSPKFEIFLRTNHG